MSVGQIYLWRHGQTDWNLAGKIQGSSDIPLNATGIAQAERVAPQLAKLDIDSIFVSDLGRAQETAATVARRINVTPVVDPRLRERAYGEWEGLSGTEIQEGWPDQWVRWREGADPLGVGVETRDASGERFAEGVYDAIKTVMEGGNVLFVAHGGVISNGIMTMLGFRPSEFNPLVVLDNAHWAMMMPRPGAEDQLRLRSYNQVLADPHDLERLEDGEVTAE